MKNKEQTSVIAFIVANIISGLLFGFDTFFFTIKFILGGLILIVSIFAESRQYHSIYGYTYLNEQYNGTSSTRIIAYTFLGYLFVGVIYKLTILIPNCFIAQANPFNFYEQQNYTGFYSKTKSVLLIDKSGKLIALFDWMKLKVFEAKNKLIDPNVVIGKISSLISTAEQKLSTTQDLDLIDSYKKKIDLYLIDIIKNRMINISIFIRNCNIIISYNFIIYNSLYFITFFFLLKIIVVAFFKIIPTPKILVSIIEFLEESEMKDDTSEKENKTLERYFLIFTAEKVLTKAFVAILTILFVIIYLYIYKHSGLIIPMLQVIYASVIIGIITKRIQGRLGYNTFYLLFIVLFLSFIMLEMLVLYFNGDLLLGQFSIKTIIFYTFCSIVMFLMVTINNRDELSVENSDIIIKQKDLENSLLQSRLDTLKNQINTHFIVNSLNFVRSKSLPLSVELSNAILLFSKIMRYSLTEAVGGDNTNNAATHTVPLEKEIEHLYNYIDFNQLRFSNGLAIDFTKEGSTKFKTIVPLLLINYVENAIKYGDLHDFNHPMIIRLKIQENVLIFFVKNKKGSNPAVESTKVGNVNTKKRLELIYPDRHELTIIDEPDFYTVSLTIQL